MNDRLSDLAGSAAPSRLARPLHPVPFTAVTLNDGLWAPRQRAVRERTLPFFHGQLERHGVLEALDVHLPPGPLRVPFNGRPTTSVMYWDSDIGKWIEMAAYTLATKRDGALEARIDGVIAPIAKAQQPDGYFNVLTASTIPIGRRHPTAAPRAGMHG